MTQTKSKEERLTRYEQDVMRSVKDNHMWINAFAAIRPSDALKMEIGDYILGKLASEDALILSDHDDSVLAELQMKEVVIRFNKS